MSEEQIRRPKTYEPPTPPQWVYTSVSPLVGKWAETVDGRGTVENIRYRQGTSSYQVGIKLFTESATIRYYVKSGEIYHRVVEQVHDPMIHHLAPGSFRPENRAGGYKKNSNKRLSSKSKKSRRSL